MRKVFLLFVTMAVASMAGQRVYVVHGFYSAPIFMQGIADRLEQNGYSVSNWDYDSRLPIDSIACCLRKEIADHASADTLNFVTHSMGGIIVRTLLDMTANDTAFPRVDRIVMIAPPNQGSELADAFAHIEFVRWMVGPNVDNLASDSLSFVNHLPRLTRAEVGIIAGSGSTDFGFNPLIKGNNDGYISVDRAKLGTEKEFKVVQGAHVFITLDKNVQEMTCAFLKAGRFE